MTFFGYHAVLFTLAILFDGLRTSHGLDAPQWIIEEKREKYRDYEVCLNDRESDFKAFQDSERYHAVSALQDSNVLLKCFDCLDPADEEVLEVFDFILVLSFYLMLQDIWKPNGSFIRRKVTELLDKIRDAVRRFKQKGKPDIKMKTDERLQAHCWEYSSPQNETWIKLIEMSEPKESYVKASKTMKSFMGEGKNRCSIGDLFELTITRADESDTGWYRCYQCKNPEIVSRAYFLEIFPHYEIEMREYSQTVSLQSKMVSEIKEHNVEVFGKASSWSKCNKCGENVIGESKRQISCYIRPLKSSSRSKYRDTGFSALQLFGELPCQSSLIPKSVRDPIQKYPVYEEFQQCKVSCLPSKNETRIVEGADESGMPFEFDRFLPGEFSLNERLPLLKSHVRRKVVSKIEKKPMVLDCDLKSSEGILWRRKLIKEKKLKQLVDISSSTLIKENPDGRIIINANGQLIFKYVKLEDSGLYSCSTQLRGLMATFKVFIKLDPEGAAKVIGWVQVGVRFVFFSCLVILVVTVMLRARQTAKKAVNNKDKV